MTSKILSKVNEIAGGNSGYPENFDPQFKPSWNLSSSVKGDVRAIGVLIFAYFILTTGENLWVKTGASKSAPIGFNPIAVYKDFLSEQAWGRVTQIYEKIRRFRLTQGFVPRWSDLAVEYKRPNSLLTTYTVCFYSTDVDRALANLKGYLYQEFPHEFKASTKMVGKRSTSLLPPCKVLMKARSMLSWLFLDSDDGLKIYMTRGKEGLVAKFIWEQQCYKLPWLRRELQARLFRKIVLRALKS